MNIYYNCRLELIIYVYIHKEDKTIMKDGIYLTRPLFDSLKYYAEVSEKSFSEALKLSELNEDTRARIIVVIDNKIKAVRIPGMLDWKNNSSVSALTLEASLAAFEERDDDEFKVEYSILDYYMTKTR